MANNALVNPLVFSLPALAQNRAQDSRQEQPQPTPVSITKIMGEHVKVKVEAKGRTSAFTIPEFVVPQSFSEWIREPTQEGDKGWLVESNYYLGGVSGLGGGTASYHERANMTPLVFQPISQKQFPHNTSRPLNAVFMNGPDGAISQNTSGTTVVAAYKDASPLHGKAGCVGAGDGNVYIGPNPASKIVYLGATVDSSGALQGSYDFVMTASGPSINVKARIG